MRGGALVKEFGTMNASEIFDHLGWEKPISKPTTENSASNNEEEAPTHATRLLNKKRKLMKN